MPTPKKKDVPINIPVRIVREILLKGKAEDKSLQRETHDVIVDATHDMKVIRSLAPYFKTGLIQGNSAFIGSHSHSTAKYVPPTDEESRRVHVKLTVEEWEHISQFQRALDIPLSHVLLWFLEIKIQEGQLI